MAFADVDDIAARLGRDLSGTADTAMADSLIEARTALIAQALGKDDGWAAGLTPVPTIIRVLTVAGVARVMSNPNGLVSVQERLGQYNLSQSFRDIGEDIFLTDQERTLLRQAVGVTGSTSVHTGAPVLEHFSEGSLLHGTD